MTKKERTIKAFKELAHKYRNPEDKTFFSNDHCPLCAIHFVHIGFVSGVETIGDCMGCPLANMGEREETGYGCMNFHSYQEAEYEGEGYYICRAKFFEKYLPVIKKWPESRFTKKGWKYSGDEISRED